MADQSPAPAYTPNGAVMPSTSVFSAESTSGTSKSKMTKEDLAEFHAWKAAKDEQLAAMKSPAPEAGLPNEADVQADISSREQSAMAPTTAPNYAAMAPDSPEYQKAISGAMSGNQAPAPPPAAPDVVVPKSFPEDTVGNPQAAYPLAPNDISARAAPRATSQQFNASPAMQPPKTLEAAQDEAARDEGAYKAKVATATAQQMAEIERQKQERLQAVQAEYERMSQQFLASGKVKPMEPTFLQRFSVALGAFGAGLTGGQNYAQQMLQHQMDLDMEAQKANLQTAMERLKMAGARPEQIMQFEQQQTLQAQAMQKAKLDAFDAQSQKLLAPFPQFQQKAAITIATAKTQQAEKFADYAAKTTSDTATTGYTSPHTTTVTAPNKDVNKEDQTAQTIKKVELQEGESAANELRKIGLPSADTLEKLRVARQEIAASNAAAGTKVGILQGRILRGVGLEPDAALDAIQDPTERRRAHLLETAQRALIRGEARGTIEPEQENKQLEQSHGAVIAARTPEEQKAIIAGLQRRFSAISALEPKTAQRTANATTPPEKLTGQQFSKLTAAEKKAYTEARLEKPSSKDYAEAQAAIRSLTRKAMGSP